MKALCVIEMWLANENEQYKQGSVPYSANISQSNAAAARNMWININVFYIVLHYANVEQNTPEAVIEVYR